MTDRLLDINELADWLGVKVAWLHSEVQMRRIPSVKLGNKTLRFRESEIETYIAAHARPATGPQPTARSRKTA